MGTRRGYVLRCTGCGTTYDDDGVRLDCSGSHPPALLRSVFKREFSIHDTPSLMRYRDWLPLGRTVETSARTAVYRSTQLAAQLGLQNLWIAFSGWWPERRATLATSTFKELEAYAVLGRLSPHEQRTLVIASAGNTAAAFARAATEIDAPVLIVIPLGAWERLAQLVDIGPTVRIIAIEGGQYEDAIAFSRGLASDPAYVLEGGVRNVARRDGMGTAMLEAVEAIGALPDVYVQGIGSGAGALAAHEAAVRIVADGRFGSKLPRLFLGQNSPFTPVHDAWSRKSETLEERNPETAREQIRSILASVLSNVAPPYAVSGGLKDALRESSGATFAVTNDEARAAMTLFEECEGIDIEPAPGVALGSLMQAVRNSSVERDATILLHVTGGGAARRPQTARAQEPALVVPLDRTRWSVVV
jgi:cysteate synthase